MLHKFAKDKLSLIFLTLLLLIEFGPVPHLQNIGFYCGDPKISHKFTGDTIRARTLIAISFIAPFLVCCLIEYSRSSNRPDRYGVSRLSWFRRALLWYKEYFIGLLFCYVIIDVAKVIVGEPRPHFLDTCQPAQAVNCTQGYIAHYTCTNKMLSGYLIRDSYKSFPSGHAAFSVYSAVFTIWYLQRRMIPVTYTLLPLLQILCIVWALCCSLTRITDRRHHWWDVLAGSIVGVATSVYAIKIFCCDFQLDSYQNLLKVKNTVSDVKENGILHRNGNVRQLSVRRLLTMPTGIVDGHHELNQVHS
ncbi:phospholipid phosphatase homolog 1.2 homolog isoform X2 [Bemisia tabaci]|uniref:phospholipid phosphatase homolog 1.2 homolog isoform X2 n=1 Tax=Bemisia tabaci TaxID=7038 RepID=UPI0008F9E2D4|nr:PREDICTED: uncharacterized protein T28D9.3-like isoform X2 [Bemisia tabaci]